MEPRVTGRPRIPQGYGVEPGGPYLEWSEIELRLADSIHYWMVTVRPDGRPHAVPRWGVWLDARFWYDGSPQTRHALNIVNNPQCTLNLEDGSAATIVEGLSAASDPVTGELGSRLSADFRRKYEELGYAPEQDAWSGPDAGGLLVFTPVTAIAWSRFPVDVTRFRFE
jgi:hypothetical protein